MAKILVQDIMSTALDMHRRGQMAEAEHLYRLVLEHLPDNGDAIHLLGLIARQNHNSQQAYSLLRRSIILMPNFAEGHNNFGNLLRDMGLDSEALVAYGHAVTLRPDLAEAWNNIGLIYLNKGHPDLALQFTEYAVFLRPEQAEAHFNIGRAQHEIGNLTKAISGYRNAMICKPDLCEAMHRLGSALHENGAWDAAVDALCCGPAWNWHTETVTRELSTILGTAPQITAQARDPECFLSIVIPTYARCSYLQQLFETLLPQITEENAKIVEIVISDNCSDDGTEAMCCALAARYPFIRYDRNSYNAGGQINVIAAVFKGRGRFTWIIGDDDVVLPGAVDTVLHAIAKDTQDVILLNKKVKNTDFTLTLLSKQVMLDDDQYFDSLNAMAKAYGLLTNISFLSAVVFRSSPFLACDAALFIGMNTYYAHLGMLLTAFHNRPCCLLAAPLVIQRVFNMRRSEENRDETIAYSAYINILRMFLYFEDQGIYRFADFETLHEEHLPKRVGERGDDFTWADLAIEGMRQGFLKHGRPSRDDLFTVAHVLRKVTQTHNRQKIQLTLDCLLHIDRHFRRLGTSVASDLV